MLRPNQQGQLTELSLKQREQIHTYRLEPAPSILTGLRRRMPHRAPTPYPTPEVSYVAKPRPKI